MASARAIDADHAPTLVNRVGILHLAGLARPPEHADLHGRRGARWLGTSEAARAGCACALPGARGCTPGPCCGRALGCASAHIKGARGRTRLLPTTRCRRPHLAAGLRARRRPASRTPRGTRPLKTTGPRAHAARGASVHARVCPRRRLRAAACTPGMCMSRSCQLGTEGSSSGCRRWLRAALLPARRPTGPPALLGGAAFHAACCSDLRRAQAVSARPAAARSVGVHMPHGGTSEVGKPCG